MFRKTTAIILGRSTGLLNSFILEVVGGMGAVWGGSQVTGLRDEHNKEAWQAIAFAIGALAFLKWSIKQAVSMQETSVAASQWGFFSYFNAAAEKPLQTIAVEKDIADKHGYTSPSEPMEENVSVIRNTV